MSEQHERSADPDLWGGEWSWGSNRITIYWLIGLVMSALGFLLSIVALTLPWTLVFPRYDQQIGPGGPSYLPFVTRISNYEPASTVSVLGMIVLALATAVCFAAAGWLGVVMRVAVTVCGAVFAWATGITYLLMLRTVDYGYALDLGESARRELAIAGVEPRTGLVVFCVGLSMLSAGAAIAIRRRPGNRRVDTGPVSVPRAARLLALGCAAVALVMLVGSFAEPWLRELPPTPVRGLYNEGFAGLGTWLAAFRVTIVAALVLLTIAVTRNSPTGRRGLALCGLAACVTSLTVLLIGRGLAWTPLAAVEVRYTYYLAIGAATLLTVPFGLYAVAGRSEPAQDELTP